MKNKNVAALLAFFFGSFGVQYFYLGKVWRGVLCILFIWTLIPAFISIIDFIRFLVMSDEAFNRKYNGIIAAPSSPAPVLNSNYHPSAPDRSPKTSMEAMDELEKLYELKENGILTEEEFSMRKKMMLHIY